MIKGGKKLTKHRKIKAVSSYGSNGKAEFYDDSGNLVYFSSLEKGTNISCVKLFNKEKILISDIKYVDSRNVMATKYTLQVNNQKYLFGFCKDSANLQCKCKDENFYLKRGFFDKGFTFYSNDEEIMKARTHTIFRDYLKANYTINISETRSKEEIDFLISVCLIYFILVYEAATFSQGNNIGSV